MILTSRSWEGTKRSLTATPIMCLAAYLATCRRVLGAKAGRGGCKFWGLGFQARGANW